MLTECILGMGFSLGLYLHKQSMHSDGRSPFLVFYARLRLDHNIEESYAHKVALQNCEGLFLVLFVFLS